MQFLTALADHERFQRWDIHEDEVAEALDRSQPATYADAIRTVYQLYAQRVGKPRFGDKTPRYSIDIPLLAALFQEAVFIHIIRDGRDVALVPDGRSTGAGSCPRSCRCFGVTGWRPLVAVGLSSDPSDIARFAMRNWSKSLNRRSRPCARSSSSTSSRGCLDYFEHVRAMPDPALGVRYRPRHHTRLVLPPTKGLRDWRTQMSTRDLAVFEANAGDLLSELGYERGCAHIPLHTSIGQRANDIAATARSSMGAAARRLVAHNS